MAEKHELQIHCTNEFHPKPLGITHLALNSGKGLIAIVRKLYCKNDQENLRVRYIEIYRMLSKLVLVHSFVEYDQVTGIEWLSKDVLVTVSLEQTINVYSIKTGQKIFSTITDYGPISSMKLSLGQNLLLTGTEYGYVAAYRIGEKNKSVEPINKMVKINGPVSFLDIHITLNDGKKPETRAKVIANKPTKRKRATTSDGESESEEDEDDSVNEYLSDSEILIFGASGGDVVVWNYHKKTIIDTVHIGEDISVNALLTLSNGEVVVGDSSGTVSVLDTSTLTCRYSTSVLETEVLCLTKSFDENSLLVSGQDSAIIIMQRDKSNRDEYRLKEKIEAHTNRITSLCFWSKKGFLSGSLEGFLSRYKRGKENRLKRETIGPHFSDKITYFDGEMMIQNHKSLEIFKLLKTDRNNSNPAELTNIELNRVLRIKSKNHVQSCVFNDKYIAYSGPHMLIVFHRDSPDKTTHLHADESLQRCTNLKLCGNYLVACSNNDLTVIELDTKHKDVVACRVVCKHSLKSIVQKLLYVERTSQLVVSCGPIKNLIYRLDLNPESAEPFSILDCVSLQDERISFMVPGLNRNYEYIYTDTDKILRMNVTTTLNESKIQKRLSGKSSVQGLPKDAHVLGMIILTKDHGILYDSNCMYKIDLNSNEIVNHSSNYNQIVTMDNLAFGDPQDVALAELSPDDYRSVLPSVGLPKKKPFGCS